MLSISRNVHMCVCLCVCVFVCVSVSSLFEVPFNGLFAPTSRSRISKIFRDLESLVYKSKCPYVCLFVCLSVCLSVCLFTFEVPFNGLFAPTFRSRMSNIFRDSESLGKSNGKKWSHIWTFLFGSGLKSPRKKKLVFLLILPYKTWWKPRFPMD